MPKPARPQMEVYTTGHASSWVDNALPSPLTSFYYLLMSGSITGLAYFIGDKWFGDGTMWMTVAIALMTVIGLVLIGFNARKAKKAEQEQGEGFESALRGSSSGWDDAISSPADIARLDELRTTFLKGIQTFNEYGKDLYSMPWYVIVGEPGSGKTEAIRRSELRFPDMLQDKLQGTGGTYSMHWWFTNQAIILDTAGAMLMQPEAASRFEEFLKLLHTYRTACPINGMILTIPTDSLLSDPPHAAEQKARVIATQLAMIQKALDVRFPIYLMVSKSDRLPGFREFFDMEGQSKFERHMMGWANPAPLGEPFTSDTIYTAIDAISRRLQSRCLALLENPEPLDRSPGSRRADEIDAVYNFPGVLRNLAPRLKLYLDVIFQTGTWAKKPPFFRGIFFTTALREGAQLDADLAKSLGLPIQQLPPGGIFAREKSAFLRDFFLEKIFPEKGLVTRLFDVGAHLRKRLTTFYCATAALLIVCLGFAWMVKVRIEEQLGEEQTMWAAANATWQNGTFLRIIGRSASWSDQIPDRPSWYLAKSDSKTGKTFSPIEELVSIRDRLDAKVSLSWVFYPIPEWRDFLERRQNAYLTLFEGSVMKPVIDAARERILWDVAPGNTTSPDTQQHLAAAYQRLLQLEVWIRQKEPIQAPDWEKWFKDLILYVIDPLPPGGMPADFPANKDFKSSLTDKETIEAANLARRMADTAHEVYSTKVRLDSRKWLSETLELLGDDRLRSLSEGSRLLLGLSGAVEQTNEQELQHFEEVTRAATAFLTTEDDLDRMCREKLDVPLLRIESLLRDLNLHAQRISNSKPLGGASIALTRFKAYLQEIQSLATTLQNEDKFFERLKTQADAILSGKAESKESKVPSNLSENVLADSCYLKRLNLYMEALNSSKLNAADQHLSKTKWIGKLASLLVPPQSPPPLTPADGKPSVPAYSGPRAEVFQRITRELLPSFEETLVIERQVSGYLRDALLELRQMMRFPLVKERDQMFSRRDLDEFKTKCELLAKMGRDIEVFDEKRAELKSGESISKLERLFREIRPMIAISRALYDDQLKNLRKVTVAPSKPKEFKEEPLQPQPAPTIIGEAPIIAPPPPPKVIPGFKELVIETSDGDFITQTPSNVVPKEVPCTVGLKVSYTYINSATSSSQSRPLANYANEWGMITAVIAEGRPVWRIDNILSISLDFKPELPSRWPSKGDLLDVFKTLETPNR